jgi:Asp-tRNA(Asn)/Glu-tRNA(Gln) amidotransferase A subunit family amidase
MVSATEAAAQRLAAAGGRVREVKLPPVWPLMAAAKALLASERSTVMAQRMAEQAENLGPKNRISLEVGTLVLATYYLQAQRIRRWMTSLLLDLFADVDVLLMPTAPGPAPHGIHTSGDPSLLSPWSFVGYPGISICRGLSPDGLPLGIQFVGPPRAEDALFHAAAWAERVLGRLPAPPLARPTLTVP